MEPSPFDQARQAVQDFLKLESASGVLLMIAAAMAMLVANSPLADYYETFFSTYFTISFGNLGLSKPLIYWINDGLMAVFFLLVGMEIKREVREGELSSLGQAVLPFCAAAGGVAAPALIFWHFNAGDISAMRGWAIPTATDIAFSLGVLSLLGSRVPVSLKIFLMAVAVIDDLMAIVIIALFYTGDISLYSLGIGAACILALLWMNWKGVNRYGPYVVVGLIMWIAVLKSGVHATLAGVVLGFMIPLKVKDAHGKPMLAAMEHALHPWVAYAILPLFAFANSGIDFSDITLAALGEPVTLGIAAGLLLGKQAGIFIVAALLILLRLARLPEGATWPQFYAVCLICGIGFTMSLFIGDLAFEDLAYQARTRLGVMLGSLCSALAGGLFLLLATRSSANRSAL